MALSEWPIESHIPICSSRRDVLWPEGVRPIDNAMSAVCILLPIDVETQLELSASRRGMTVGELVRCVIENHLNGHCDGHLHIFSPSL